MKVTAKIFAAFCLALSAPLRAEAARLTIEIPSVMETVFESGRDFYVAGKIDREGTSAREMPIDIRVEVTEAGLARDGEGEPLRVVESRVNSESGITDKSDLAFDYGEIAPWVNLTEEELCASPPPDIVFRAEMPDSFFDPRVKVAVTEESYAALVQGGVTKDFDSDYPKIYDKNLEWRNYRVTVSALCKGRVVAETYKDVTFGSVPEKMLTSPFPPEHFEKVSALARGKGWRLYTDPFPGGWDAGLPAACEIPIRRRANNALEYASGFVHAVIYNIAETSERQRTEIGRMAYDGRMFRDDEVFFYIYDIGEPSLTYDAGGAAARREGRLVRLECGERLRFTRAEIGERPEKYFPSDNAGRVDWSVGGSFVALRPGEPVTLYGAVTPIQPRLSETEPESDGTFTVKNRIARLRLLIEEISRGEKITDEFPVKLERFYDKTAPDKASPSVYEFRRTLRLPPREGKSLYTVTARALDSRGEPIEGAQALFYLWVR